MAEKKNKNKNKNKKGPERLRRINIAFNLVMIGMLMYALVFYVIYKKNLEKYLIPAIISSFFYYIILFFSFVIHQVCRELSFKKRFFIYITIYFLIMVILTPLMIFPLLAGYFLSDDNFFKELSFKKIYNFFTKR